MDIKTFVSEVFGNLYVLFLSEILGYDEPLFWGYEVCKKLGYVEPSNALAKLSKEDVFSVTKNIMPENIRNVLWTNEKDTKNKILITEYGLYELVMRSHCPNARPFQKWVTHTVLPAITNNGSYVNGQEYLSKEEFERLQLAINKEVERAALLSKRWHKACEERDALKDKYTKLYRKDKAVRKDNDKLIHDANEMEDLILKLREQIDGLMVRYSTNNPNVEDVALDLPTITINSQYFIV